ncbi:MAG: hypothetical protein U0271_24085 [Polyangiaceae bacterium]
MTKHYRSTVVLVGLLGFSAAALAACGDGGSPDGGGGSGAGTETGGDANQGGSSHSAKGLPCDVTEVVERACLTCHGDPPSSSAPQSLTTVADWQAPAPSDNSRTNGEVSVERMNDASRPMPPGTQLSAADIAVISDWVDAGMPSGDCEPVTPEDPILNADPVCTSGDTWPANSDHVFGKMRSEMFPGMPCNDCHTNPSKYGFFEYAPEFAVAGTVFPSGHEPDLCAGLDGTAVTDVTVHIEDSAGRTFDLKPNAAGNFLLETFSFTPPYSAKVVSSVGERAMSLKPTSGDCNFCHTQNGSAGENPSDPVAPGRIVVPLAPN